jgi:short-subunit dehydrogenase
MEIEDTIALVTGASSGIGEANAKELARKGSRHVLLLSRSEDNLQRVAEEIVASGGTATPFPADLSDRQAVPRVAERVKEEIGTPDILVHSAGAGRWLSVDETSPGEAVQMMAVPYFAAFFVTRLFLTDMLQRKSGHIVNITSAAAFRAIPGATAYSAARWAMRGFSEALNAELRGTGIGVSLYVSGTVMSSYFENNPGSYERMPKIAKLVRELTPEEAARAIVRGIERNQPIIIVPFMMRLLILLNNLLPGLLKWLVIQTGWKRT